MKRSKIHIFLSNQKQQFIIWVNNIKTKRFFIKNHSKIIKPLHSQFVPQCCHISKGVSIDKGGRIDCYPILGKTLPQVYIGENTMICFSFTLLCAEKIIIGRNCLIASHVFISDENHGIKINNIPYACQPLITKPIEIGNNVWLGEKVIVLPGVHIGENSIIGAGSVVTNNIPENSIAVGNPAHVIKKWNAKKKDWEPSEGQ